MFYLGVLWWREGRDGKFIENGKLKWED